VSPVADDTSVAAPAADLRPSSSNASSPTASLHARLAAYEPLRCGAVEADIVDPVTALMAEVEQSESGPVPVAAARCLVELHAAEAEAVLLGWLADPNAWGLAVVVARGLDGLGEQQAKRLAVAALAGPHAERLRPRLARSSVVAVRHLALGVRP
jgi:hypothetical protein